MRLNDARPALPRRAVRCPTCRRSSEYSLANPHRPFCSQRCKEGDLGAWASGSYAVEAPPPLDDDGRETDA